MPNHYGISVVGAEPGQPPTSGGPTLEAFMFDTFEDAVPFIASYEPPTNFEVFQTWNRFSNNLFFEPGDPLTNGAGAFIYNSSADRIQCTANTTQFVGFSSPTKTRNVTIEVTVGSTAQDDDALAVIVAHEPYTNAEGNPASRFLAVMRHTGGLVLGQGAGQYYLVCLSYNDPDFTGGGYLPLGSPVNWNNGRNSNNGGWASSGKSRIRIEREGPVIRTWATPFLNQTLAAMSEIDPSEYNPNSIININTSNYPELAWVGANELAFGYGCQSQDDAYFANIEIEGGLLNDTIFVASTNSVYKYNYDTGEWDIVEGETVQSRLGNRIDIVNPNTGKKYVVDINGNLIT
tara:strand:- start:131797 stop:132837 length:1041 start_codon:yes stop_codon:yes gene_type:complete